MLPLLGIASLMTIDAPADEPPLGRITGLGGVFFKSANPKKIAAWYREILGIGVEGWDGAMLPHDTPGHPAFAIWSPFAADTDYFEPGTASYMVNFAVDDLDAFLMRLKAKGVEPVARDDSDPNGKFAWLIDPEGTKIELWQAVEEDDD